MNVTFKVPDAIAQTLGYGPDMLPRRALEALLIDECVRGRMSRGKVAELLGLSFHQAEELLLPAMRPRRKRWIQASEHPYPEALRSAIEMDRWVKVEGAHLAKSFKEATT